MPNTELYGIFQNQSVVEITCMCACLYVSVHIPQRQTN